MNPDLIGEVRMILAPVDAEVAEATRRSSSNSIRDEQIPRSRSLERRNSALDPNTWATIECSLFPPPETGQTSRYTERWRAIVKNKTFFFALWTDCFPAGRTNVNAQVRLPCA